MSESSAEPPRDSVDRILDDWARERPDLDFRPVGVVTRLARVRSRLETGLAGVFAAYDLSPADFQVIVTLRRSGAPYRLAQARLQEDLGLTSGTMSVRIDRLVARGVVVREPDEKDARVSLVRLTGAGLELFDEIAPVHLANEDRLLSALDDAERDLLSDLLRRVLHSFEHARHECGTSLGLTLEPAHLARGRRREVGLRDVPGLRVVEVAAGSPAADGGVRVGDLLVEANGTPVRDVTGLQRALAGAPSPAGLVVLRGDRRVEVRLT